MVLPTDALKNVQNLSHIFTEKTKISKLGELCNQKYYYRGGYQFFETGRKQNVCRPEYDKLKEVMNLNNSFDDILFNNHTFNFEDIKTNGTPYIITRKAQKLYGVKSNLGEYTQINNGTRNPSTILEYPIIQGGKEYLGHPTQKPLEMIKYLLKSCTNENDLILDCFMGSGTTARASKELKRNFIGCDNKQEYVNLTNKRLQQEVLL